MKDAPIGHRFAFRYQRPKDSLSAPTPPSLCPSFADAPAASPEHSEIVDSNTNEPTSIENEQENISTASTFGQKPSLKRSIKSSEFGSDWNDRINRRSIDENRRDERNNSGSDDDNENDDDEDQSKISLFCQKHICSHCRTLQKYVAHFVGSKYFRRIVLSAIVVNTLSMGIEYHGQPQSLTNALEYSNIVFTCLFAVEMILKIIAEGCLKYIKNAYNLFDGCIVVISVIELQGNKNSGLSVLRTFRLLRVLKLVRFMPTLRRQLVRSLLLLSSLRLLNISKQ